MKRLEILADLALLGLILASACRPQVPTADDLADLAAVVDEARELAPAAAAVCKLAGNKDCDDGVKIISEGLDAAAPVLSAVRNCDGNNDCKAPQREEAKKALPKAKKARDTARRLAKRPAPASSASAVPAASGAP